MNVICGQMPFGYPDTIEIKPIVPALNDAWKNDESLKASFAVAWAKDKSNPFEAACTVFGKETNKALYASVHWVKDEIVTEAKQNYTEVTDCPQKILDKTELSLRLLTFSEEKLIWNGNEVYAAEAKDRLAALKLYAEIQGFTNKNEINLNNNFTKNNFMELRFVEPDKKETKIIEHQEIIQEENILENSPIKLKLVG